MTTTTIKLRPAWRVLIIAYVAFVLLGLMDGLLGVAWPSMRATFGVPLDALGILLLATTSGHILASFSNGRLLAATGMAGLLLLAIALRGGAVLTQTLAPTWWLLVGAGFVSGLGLGMMDAGMNTFAAARFRPRLINWMHASFGIGTTFGSLLMTAVLGLGWSWRVGLGILAAANGVLFLLFLATRSRWTLPEEETESGNGRTPARETLALPSVWLSIAIFALYTGTELGVGQWSFTLFTESRGVAETAAGLWTTLYWGSFTVGRIILGFVETNLSQLIRWSLLVMVGGIVLFAANLSPALSLVGLLLAGFSMAPLFPGLIALTPERIGPRHAANAIGFQVGAAGVGAAILPGLAGVLGDTFGLEIIALFFVGTGVLLLALYRLSLSPERQRNGRKPGA